MCILSHNNQGGIGGNVIHENALYMLISANP